MINRVTKFGNVWKLALPGSSVPETIVTNHLSFSDGVRSVVGIYYDNVKMSGEKGWIAIHTGAAGSVPSSTTQTAAKLDARLGAGDVLFYMDGNVGTSSTTGARLAPGWYSHTLAGTSARQQKAFVWGTQKLAALVSQGVTAGAQPGQPAAVQAAMVPAQQAMQRTQATAAQQQQTQAAAAVAVKSRAPLYLGGLVALGVVTYLILG